MEFSNLANTQSPEMCEFYTMIFKSNNAAQKMPDLMWEMRKTMLRNSFIQCRDKITSLMVKKEKVEYTIDRLSGDYAIPNEHMPRLKKCLELYNTINNCIAKKIQRLERI